MKNKKIFAGLVGGLSIFLVNPNTNKVSLQAKKNYYHPKATFSQVAPRTIEQVIPTPGAYADSELSNQAYQNWVNSNPVSASLDQEYQASDHFQNGLEEWKKTGGKGYTVEEFVANARSNQPYARWWGTRPQKLKEQWLKSSHFKRQLAAFQARQTLNNKNEYADSTQSDASYERWRKLGAYAPGLADLYRNRPQYQDPLYNTWRLTRANGLKAAWEATGTGRNEYLGVVNTWFTNSMPLFATKALWIPTIGSNDYHNAWRTTNTDTAAKRQAIWETTANYLTAAKNAVSVRSYATGDTANFKNFFLNNLDSSLRLRGTFNIAISSKAAGVADAFGVRNVSEPLRWILFEIATKIDGSGHVSAAMRAQFPGNERRVAQSAAYRAIWNTILTESDTKANVLTDLIATLDEVYEQRQSSALRDDNYETYAKAQFKTAAHEAAYSAAFRAWDSSPTRDAEMKTYWGTLPESTTDYVNFKKETYKDTVESGVYNTGLDAWSATKANGWAAYQASDDYARDFGREVSLTRSFGKKLAAWSKTKANGLDAYKTSKFLTHDYNKYIKELYLESDTATTDYETWGASKTNGGQVYKQSAQGNQDKEQWKSSLYLSQPEYTTNKRNWLSTKANGLRAYKASTQVGVDFHNYLRAYNARVDEFYQGQVGVSNEQYNQTCQGDCNVAYQEYQDDAKDWNKKFITSYVDDYFTKHTTSDLFTRAEVRDWETKVAGLNETEKEAAAWRFFDQKLKTLEAEIQKRTRVPYQDWLKANGLTYREWLTTKLTNDPQYLVNAWKNDPDGGYNKLRQYFVDYTVQSKGLITQKRDIRYWATNTSQGQKAYEKYLKARVNTEGIKAQQKWVELRQGVMKSGTPLEAKYAIGQFKAKYPYWYNYVVSGKNQSLRPHWEKYLQQTHPEWNSAEKWSRLFPQEFARWRVRLANDPKRYEFWKGSRTYDRKYKEYVRTTTNRDVRSKDTLDKYIAHADNQSSFSNWLDSKDRFEKWNYFLGTKATKDKIKVDHSYDSWLRHDAFSYYDLFLNSLRNKSRINDEIWIDPSTQRSRKSSIYLSKHSQVSWALYQIIKNLDGGSYRWKTIYQDFYDYQNGKNDRYYQKWVEFLTKVIRQGPAHVVNQLRRFIRLQHNHSSSTINNSHYLQWAMSQYQSLGTASADFGDFDGTANTINSYKEWYKKDSEVTKRHIAFLKYSFENDREYNTLYPRWLRSESTFLHDISSESELPVGQGKYISFLENQYMTHHTHEKRTGTSDDSHGDDTSQWKKTNLWKRDWNQILLKIDSVKKAQQLMYIEDLMEKEVPWNKSFGFLKSFEALSGYQKWTDPAVTTLTEQDFIDSKIGKKGLQKFYNHLLTTSTPFQTIIDDHKKVTSQAYLDYLLRPRQLKKKALRGKTISHSVWLAKYQFEKVEALLKSYLIDEEVGSNKAVADRYRKDYVYNALLWIKENEKRYQDYLANYDAFVASEKAKDYYLED